MIGLRSYVGWYSPRVGVALSLGLLSASLRLPRALTSPFWQDEVASARILDEHSFVGMIRRVVHTESTPPLWYALAWLVHRGGVSVHDVRLLSVAANFALVALVVSLAARLVPLKFAALAGLLVALGSEFSAEGRWIRAYELFAVLAAALLFAAVAAAAKPTRGRLGRLAGVVAAGSLTHYFFLFTVAAVVVWLWLEPEARATRRRTSAAVAVGLVPFALWSPAFAAQLQHRRYGWIGPLDGWEVLETPLRLFTPFGSGSTLVLAATIACLLLLWGIRVLWRQGAYGRLCVCLGVVPLALATGTWGTGIRVYAVRNMIGIGPFLAVAAVAGLAGLPGRLRVFVPAGVAILSAGSFVWAQQYADSPAFNRIASVLVAEGWHAGDAVVVYGSRTEFRSPLGWYLPHHPNLTITALSHLRSPFFVIGTRLTAGTTREEVAARRVENITVARLNASRGLIGRIGRGAHVFLAAPTGTDPAVHGDEEPVTRRPFEDGAHRLGSNG